jgi:hypothetical protein
MQFPPTPGRVLRFKHIANWVRVLHVYPNRESSYVWTLSVFDRLNRAVGHGAFLPRLEELYLNREDIDGPCHMSFHWALLLLNRNLRGIEFSTNNQFSGLDITHQDACRLLSEAASLQVPLENIAIRCPDMGPELPPPGNVNVAISYLGRLRSLAQLSITGSLLNAASLATLGSLPKLKKLQIVGSLLEDIHTGGVCQNAFPALRILSLQYLDDEQTWDLCSVVALTNTLKEVLIEWDSNTEADSPSINKTIMALATHSLVLKRLRLGWSNGVITRKAHRIPKAVWKQLRLQTLGCVELIHLTLDPGKHLMFADDLKATWPNLKYLILPCQTFSLAQLCDIDDHGPGLRLLVHSQSCWGQKGLVFPFVLHNT